MFSEPPPISREEHTSRGDDDYHPPRPRTHRFSLYESSRGDLNDNRENRPHARPGPQSARSRSEFVPFPNTRAAEYLTTIGSRLQASRQPETDARRPPLQYDPSLRAESGRDRLLQNDGGFDHENQLWSGGADARDAWTNGPDYGENANEHDGDWDQDEADGWEQQEDGEVLPSALRDEAPRNDAIPTPVPSGGFPSIHRDDPESAVRGMALEWMREIWSDAPNSDVLVHVYNYRFTDNDTLNRRVAEALRWVFEVITGESGFDVVPPEPEEGLRQRQRDLPCIWAIRGLTPRGTAAATDRGTWSFEAISFIASPRSTTMQSWLFTLEGFLEGNEQKIRNAVLRVLTKEPMQQWIADMISANPSFAGRSTEQAMEEILDSLRVEVMQLGNGSYVANVHLRSPTRSLREWRRWVSELRSRRYRTFAIGTGRVRYVAPCSGCSSVAHPAHLCPFPRLRGWNGPGPGEGVFGDRSARTNDRRRTSTTNTSMDWPGAGRGPRRNDRDRRTPRNESHQNSRQPSPRRRRNERNDRNDRND